MEIPHLTLVPVEDTFHGTTSSSLEIQTQSFSEAEHKHIQRSCNGARNKASPVSKLNLLVQSATLVGIMFRGQQSEQAGEANVFEGSLFKLHTPVVSGADCDRLEAAEETSGVQGNTPGT